ncbi:lipopolysaccharide biosynthesis protein [Legionella impletisoli]|nr:oligosaccharide flippase family protein [Legionella impletisoli]
MKEELKYTYILFLLGLVGYVIKYGLNVFLARNLEVHLYGDFSVAIKFLNILISLILFGTNVSSQRFLSNYLRTDATEVAKHYIAWNLKLIWITSLLCIFIAFFSNSMILLLDYLGIHDYDDYHLAVFIFWIAPIAAFVKLISNYFLSAEQVYFSVAISSIFSYFIQFVIFAIAVLFLGTTLDNVSLTIGLFVSFLILAILSTLTLNENILFMMRGAIKQLKKIDVYHKEWLPKSASFISTAMIFLIISIIDLIIVEVFATSEKEVGHYAAALSITGVLWLPNNLYQAVKPHMVSLLKTPEGSRLLQHKLDTTNIAVASIFIVLTSIIIYFSSSLLSHFGPSYDAAQNCVIILSVGICLSSLINFSNILLLYKGYERFNFRLNIAELLALCLFVPPATIYFGISGTAMATIIIIIIRNGISTYLVRKYIHIRSFLFL